MLQSRIDAFLQAEQLPPTYAGIVQDCHRKIAAWLVQQQETKEQTLVLGINGAQGTGKTTMARSGLPADHRSAGNHHSGGLVPGSRAAG